MRALILTVFLLAAPVAQAQYYVPPQAWGYRPYAYPAPAYNPQFHARVQAHQMRFAQQRAMNPWGAALDDLRWEMRQEMDRRAAEDVLRRRTTPSQWWEEGTPSPRQW